METVSEITMAKKKCSKKKCCGEKCSDEKLIDNIPPAEPKRVTKLNALFDLIKKNFYHE